MSDKEKIIYCAALLEGEGSFLKKSKYSLYIQCQMTDLDILQRLEEYLGGSILKLKNRKPSKWKDSWAWTLTGEDAEDACRKMLPYMGYRRSKQIRKLLQAKEKRRKEVEKFNQAVDRVAEEYLNSDKSLRQLQRETGFNRQTILRHSKKLEA